MERTKIFEEVKEILIDELGIESDVEIKDNTKIAEDLEADSLDFVGVVIKIEKKYNIKMSDEDLEGRSTVGDLVDCIISKM